MNLTSISQTLAELREQRSRFDVAIAALEGLTTPPPTLAEAVQRAPVKKVAAPKPAAPKSQASAPAAQKKPGPPAQYDTAVLDVLHLSGDAGIRGAQIARRIAKPGTSEDQIQRLVSTVWNVLKRFEKEGKATVSGGVWRRAEP